MGAYDRFKAERLCFRCKAIITLDTIECPACGALMGPARMMQYPKLVKPPTYVDLVGTRAELRHKCLALLGGVCAQCDEVDFRVLEIDHKHDDGAQARDAGFRGEKLYRHVLEVGAAEYQILCVKHNRLKYLETLERAKK